MTWETTELYLPQKNSVSFCRSVRKETFLHAYLDSSNLQASLHTYIYIHIENKNDNDNDSFVDANEADALPDGNSIK